MSIIGVNTEVLQSIEKIQNPWKPSEQIYNYLFNYLYNTRGNSPDDLQVKKNFMAQTHSNCMQFIDCC